MHLRNFLFSDKFPQKYYRHVAFWLCTCLPFFFMGLIGLYTKYPAGSFTAFLVGQFGRFPNLLIDILFTYIIAYYVIPVFQRNKRTFIFILSLVLLIFMAFVSKAILWYSNANLSYNKSGELLVGSWFLLTNFFNDGSLMRCGLFLGCCMLKNYYRTSEEKIGILRENATAELQLLKAQVHPHFLFNTLNNIYSFSLNRSLFAASLVLKLSDTLRYMITECEAPLVPLEKEMKMLKDYIGLESVRYGTRLSVDIVTEGEAGEKMIAPLLLIPLVENSFKHGTSQMLDRPWIKMNICISEYELVFRLTNSKPEQNEAQYRKSGIGLTNVEKRLQLLYPAQYEFKIHDAQYTFDVFLRVPLHDVKVVVRSNNIPDLSIVYGNR